MGLFGEEVEGGGGEADEDIVRRCRISRLHYSTSKAPVAVPPPRVFVIMFFDKHLQIYFKYVRSPSSCVWTTMSTTAQSTSNDPLNQIFQGLRSRNADTRKQAALELRQYVSAIYPTYSSFLDPYLLGLGNDCRDVIRCLRKVVGR